MSDKRINLFVPTFDVEECLRQVRECLECGWTGMGYKTVEFEKAWAAYTGLPHVHFLNSATAALHLAVQILGEARGWKPGDQIITTPITFVSTNHAILYGGYEPVFADVGEDLCLDPGSVRTRIGPKTRAIMYVGMGGNAGPIEVIAAIAKEHGLALIVDAAHMAGTKHRYTGLNVGVEADACAFSFQAVKPLATGDAGAIAFREAEHDARARKLSWLGISKDTYTRTLDPRAYQWDYDVPDVGYKYNGNALMAAIALAQLPRLSADNAYRRFLAEAYDDEFSRDMPSTFEVVRHRADIFSSRHLYQVLVENRSDVMATLALQQISCGVHYKPNTEYKPFANCPGADSCPNAHSVGKRLLSLPLHLRMSGNDVHIVASALKRAIQGEL